MSVRTATATVSTRREGLRWVVADAMALTRRNLIRYVRIPTLLVFSTIQPVMFVLLFRYVFGGAIQVPGVNYVDFLMPGIFVQTAAFGSTQTGIGLAEDLSKGLIDRFRSLPMSRSAVLAGRTISDSVRNLFVVLLMLGVGYLVGFRFHAGIVPAVTGVLLAVGFGTAFSWISAWIGLSIRDVESTQAAGFLWIFPFTFASSAFVPVESMPGWLQAFANNQPVTATVNALRALTLGGPTAGHVLEAMAWIGGILLVFVPLSVRRYRSIA
ncbi:MAG: ABC transporter permease [Actinobacteria bacterium]|nr:ABC transporter permease [Actinomycetota bacterium]